MRKLLFILSLFLTIALNGQIRSGVVASQTTGSSGGYCTEYQAVYNAMTNKPSATNAGYQNTLVFDLKAAGVWTGFDVFYVFAQESNSASEALLCWTHPTGTDNGTNVSSTAWTTLQGFTGDGTADYINTNYNPSTEGVNFTQNSACIGMYLRNDKDENLKTADQGATTQIVPEASGATYARLNSGSVDSWTNSTSAGLLVVDRSSSTIITLYVNGSTKGNVTKVSATPANNNISFVGGPVWGEYSTRQVAIAFAGRSFNSTEQAAVNTAIEKYMDAIGTGVEP